MDDVLSHKLVRIYKQLPSPRHPPLEVSSSTLMLDLSDTEMLDILLQVLISLGQLADYKMSVFATHLSC